MNITELARRLRTTTDELHAKLPDLGFSIGGKAIKVDNRLVGNIMRAWSEMKRRERLSGKVERQREEVERRLKMREEAKDHPVALPAVLTVREFASKLELPVPRVMQELMRSGILAAINDRIDFDTAAIIAVDLGFTAHLEGEESHTDIVQDDRLADVLASQKGEALMHRPPVIVVMGHVDHGKTLLLDAIRTTNVVASESGGITQHIGAYQVERRDRKLTFIDTPGHEAFTVMRSRGAQVADLAILVVAADDGVQPQTKEAVNIIKSAKLPFVVALNKIDRAEANLDKVQKELSDLGLVPEAWGGKTIMVPISAKAGTNLETLLDMLLLVADLEKDHIVADPDRRAIGTVVESHVSEGEGPVATVLVQAGTLKKGDILGVRDALYGKVRAMRDWSGKDVQEALPSTPVKIIGWKLPPAVGDILEVPEDPKSLKKIKSTDSSREATEGVATIRPRNTSESVGDEEKKMFNMVLRADVLGSLEAILGMLDKVKHESVGVKVVAKGLGNVTDADIVNAEAAGATVFAFNTRPTTTAQALARDKKVVIHEHSIIYKLFDEVLEGVKALLPAETIIEEIGTAQILALFKKTDKGWIVGGKVKKGVVKIGAKVRLARGHEYIGEGEIISLQAGKVTVKDVLAGQEFGCEISGRNKPEIDDLMELYTEDRNIPEFVIEGIDAR